MNKKKADKTNFRVSETRTNFRVSETRYFGRKSLFCSIQNTGREKHFHQSLYSTNVVHEREDFFFS